MGALQASAGTAPLPVLGWEAFKGPRKFFTSPDEWNKSIRINSLKLTKGPLNKDISFIAKMRTIT